MPGFRSTARWQRLAQGVLDTHPPYCQAPLCACPHGRWIDLTLDRVRHPWSAHVDHIHEVQAGGDKWDPANLQLLHRRCNVAKGNRNRTRRTPVATNPSRDW